MKTTTPTTAERIAEKLGESGFLIGGNYHGTKSLFQRQCLKESADIIEPELERERQQVRSAINAALHLLDSQTGISLPIHSLGAYRQPEHAVKAVSAALRMTLAMLEPSRDDK